MRKNFSRYTGIVIILLAANSPANAAPAAELWPLWDRHDASSTRVMDHSAWQAFLSAYLQASADGVNRVDYAAVSAADREKLNAYLQTLAAIDPRTLNKNEQLAYWINMYNALTVEVVLRYPKKGSILRMGEKLFAIGPWDDKVITVAAEQLTLNDIEHRILRPIWNDHRIHFAVNCASIGCPNLNAEAYRGDNAEALLSSAETAYINHPRGVGFNKRGKLVVSSIFDWYQSDFAGSEQELLTYLSRHYRKPEQLKNYQGGVKYDYDWALNRPASE